jgi:hypothetical protein
MARISSGYKTSLAFCKKMNISTAVYSLHETGKRKITKKVALQYSNFLGINAEWLMKGDGYPHINLDKKKLEKNIKEINKNIRIVKEDISLNDLNINIILFSKIVKKITEVNFQSHITLSNASLAQECLEIYIDIIESSNALEEQLAMVNLSSTTYKKKLKDKK